LTQHEELYGRPTKNLDKCGYEDCPTPTMHWGSGNKKWNNETKIE
jgi:hypothetical protein